MTIQIERNFFVKRPPLPEVFRSERFDAVLQQTFSALDIYAQRLGITSETNEPLLKAMHQKTFAEMALFLKRYNNPTLAFIGTANWSYVEIDQMCFDADKQILQYSDCCKNAQLRSKLNALVLIGKIKLINPKFVISEEDLKKLYEEQLAIVKGWTKINRLPSDDSPIQKTPITNMLEAMLSLSSA